MPNWSPEAWNSIGVVGLVFIMGVVLFVSLYKGWLVPGWYHREIVARLDARAAEDAKAIERLAGVVTGRTATDGLAEQLLDALRRGNAEGGGSP